jgi:hypothetical protein
VGGWVGRWSVGLSHPQNHKMGCYRVIIVGVGPRAAVETQEFGGACPLLTLNLSTLEVYVTLLAPELSV